MRISRTVRRRLRRLIKPAMALIFVLGAVVFLQYFSGSWPFNSRNGQQVMDTNGVDASSFELLLQRGSLRQLKDSLNEIVYRRTDDLTIRLDQLKRRIAILDRILELPNEHDSHDIAITEKYQGLLDRELIVISRGIGSGLSTKELRDFGDTHRESTSSSVSSLALSALAVADMSQFIQKATPDRRDAMLPTAVTSFRGLLEHPDINKGNDHRMSVWLRVFRGGCSPQEFSEFAQAIGKDMPDSPLLATFNLLAVEQAFELVDVLEAIQSERTAAADELLLQIDSKLQNNELPDFVFQAILNRVDDLLRLGKVELATRAMNALQIHPSAMHDSFAKRLEVTKKNIELFKNPLNIAGLTDMGNNQPASFKNDQSIYKILFLVPVQDRDSILKFRTFQTVVKSRVLHGKIEVVLVFVDRNKTELNENDREEILQQSEHWRFWLLDTEKQEASQILNQLTINEYPYMVVLGDDQKVVFLNPPLDIISEL